MMFQRNIFLAGLALMGCGLLVYDIGLRSSGSSVLSTTLRLIPETLQGAVPKEECNLSTKTPDPALQRAVPKDECNLSTETPTFEQFFDFVEEKTPCESMNMFGGLGNDPLADGAKAACMDPKFALHQNGCVVLSFGINHEWSFDDAMEKQGCRVYAFDPFIGLEDHTRGINILFFSLGISDKEKTMDIGNKTVPLTTLRGILNRFSLLSTDIDYLKIDVEGAELDFFKNVLFEDRQLLTRVKQIGMEIHLGQLDVSLKDIYWKHIHHLRCLGFRQVSSEPNLVGGNPFLSGSRNVSQCYELVWINEAYL